MDERTLGALFIYFVILVILLIASREIYTWYTKANLQIKKLDEIIVLLTIIKNELVNGNDEDET